MGYNIRNVVCVPVLIKLCIRIAHVSSLYTYGLDYISPICRPGMYFRYREVYFMLLMFLL